MSHKHVEGNPIMQHLLVTRLLKDIYNQPITVDVVTKHLAALGSNESLSLKQLSQKLVVLKALVEACRTSKIRGLDLPTV